MEILARPMASVVHFSEAFVICAGSVLFRRDADDQWQICILHDHVHDIFVLPKGRKDCGETTRTLLSAKHTNWISLQAATLYNADKSSSAQYQCGGHATCYERRPRAFRGHAQRPEWHQDHVVVFGEREEGTKTVSENYLTEVLASDKVMKKLTFKEDRDIVHKASKLILSCYPQECTVALMTLH